MLSDYRIYMYILVSAVMCYIIRSLPMTLIRKKIDNKFIRSFLYYVPYVIIAIMTFPGIMEATESPLPGILALIAGIVLSIIGANMFAVAGVCCVTVFIVELFLK